MDPYCLSAPRGCGLPNAPIADPATDAARPKTCSPSARAYSAVADACSDIAVIDIASYGVAGLMAASVRGAPSAREKTASRQADIAPSVFTRVWVEWRAGVTLVRHDRLIFQLFLIWGLAAVAEGAFEVLIVPWVHLSLHGGAREFGWLTSAQAIGGIAGGLSIGWAGRHPRSTHMIAGSMMAIGVADFAVWNTPQLPFDLAVTAVLGFPAIGFTVGTTTLMQRNVADAFRGRVGGALGTTWSASILLAMAGASLLGSSIGAVTVLNASAVLAVMTGIAALRLHEHGPDGSLATQDLDDGVVIRGPELPG